MENNAIEKYFRHIRTMYKNHCSKGNGETEAKNACICYPEGPGWSDVMAHIRSPAGMQDLEGKVVVSRRQQHLWGLRGWGYLAGL